MKTKMVFSTILGKNVDVCVVFHGHQGHNLTTPQTHTMNKPNTQVASSETWRVVEFSGCFMAIGPHGENVEFAGNGFHEDKRLANEFVAAQLERETLRSLLKDALCVLNAHAVGHATQKAIEKALGQ